MHVAWGHTGAMGISAQASVSFLCMQTQDILGALKPTVVLLQFGSLQAGQAKLAYATYQQLLQSQDYLGHAHLQPAKTDPVASDTAGTDAKCPPCERDAKSSVIPELWLGLVRRAQLLRNLVAHRMHGL